MEDTGIMGGEGGLQVVERGGTVVGGGGNEKSKGLGMERGRGKPSKCRSASTVSLCQPSPLPNTL